MINNAVLRTIRDTAKLKDESLLELLDDVTPATNLATLQCYLANVDEANFVPMTDELMIGLLDNFVVSRRGPNPNPVAETPLPLTNNAILKKLRVAFNLQEIDLIEVLAAVECRISKQALRALFRKASHSNYHACDDQLLRQFLAGLELYLQP